MEGVVYQQAIRKFARQDLGEVDVGRASLLLMNYGLGVSGEAGELVDEIKKIIFHDKPMDRDKLINEIGDVFWYLTRLLDLLHATPEIAMDMNYSKLVKRYGNGFDNAEKKYGWTKEEGA